MNQKILVLILLLGAILFGYGTGSQTKQSVSPSQPRQQVAIYIDGSIARPGHYTIDADSKLADAVALAGGLLPTADTSKLNLNEIIDNPLYIHILEKKEPSGKNPSKTPGSNLTQLYNQLAQFRQQRDSNLPIETNGMTPLEQQMLEWINYERTSCGLAVLAPDMGLVAAARLKSQDMINNNYFNHQSPRYGSPADLLISQNIQFQCAGENLAKVGTLERGHTGLMNSPGHRENILRPEFGKIGIGIIERGSKGLMITQEFTD